MLIIAHKSGALPLSLVAATVACVAEKNPFLYLDKSSRVEEIDSDNEETSGKDEDGTLVN
jgi:hypothetical protein